MSEDLRVESCLRNHVLLCGTPATVGGNLLALSERSSSTVSVFNGIKQKRPIYLIAIGVSRPGDELFRVKECQDQPPGRM